MTIVRLVEHENPEGRATPLLLLATLRELDPTVELVYLGARDWRVGAVRLTPIRFEAGCRILDNEEARPPRERNPKNLMIGRLYRQGFAQIAKYIEPEGGDITGNVKTENGEIVAVAHHFERLCFFDRQDRGEAVMRARLLADSPEGREDENRKTFDDYMATDGRAHYAREIKGRVQMGAGGFTGTSSGLALHPKRRVITGDEVLADIAEIMRELGGEVPAL